MEIYALLSNRSPNSTSSNKISLDSRVATALLSVTEAFNLSILLNMDTSGKAHSGSSLKLRQAASHWDKKSPPKLSTGVTNLCDLHHGFCYAGDSMLYLSFPLDNHTILEYPGCLSDISTWMEKQHLELNLAMKFMLSKPILLSITISILMLSFFTLCVSADLVLRENEV